MSNKKYFSYIRVSTQRQAQKGVSLIEQRAAIERYSQAKNLEIIKHFEEHESASKPGRRIFLEMVRAIRQGKADGLVCHALDRSVRHLQDWVDIGNLIDNGVDVHYANDGLDLTSRGGRLAAEFKAVVAADYSRNLSEEVKKGFYGRLKQGFYPMPAPIGYLDAGGGQTKQIDPIKAPLIQKLFELYHGGENGIVPLVDKMFELGLRNKSGKKVTDNGISTILHNPFYMGLIRIEKTGQMFAGNHQPLISKTMFDQVQTVLAGKNIKKTRKHFFVFSRHIKCSKCGNMFIPERQKIYVYYRCHTRDCTTGAINEAVISKAVLNTFESLRMNEAEYEFFRDAALLESKSFESQSRDRERQINLQLAQIKQRFSKLADAYADGVFDKQIYNQKNAELLLEEKTLQEKLAKLDPSGDRASQKLAAFLELATSAYLSYKIGKLDERRDLIKIMTSNFSAEGKTISIKLENPFQLIATRPVFKGGRPQRGTTRTFLPLIKKLVKYFSTLDTSKDDDLFCKYLTSKKPPKRSGLFPTHSLAESRSH